METNFDLSVILPLKTSIVKNFDEFFKKAINSIQIQQVKCEEVVIVHTSDENLITYLNEFDFGDLNVVKIEYKGEPNFSSQVNYGIENAKGKWVTILEFDDEFSGIWFKNAKKYSDVYQDVDAFLPIVIDIDNKNVFAGFTNEATFANNFSQEVGFLTNDTLHQYQNFQTSGMVIKKQVITDFGGFKPSIKLSFVYEFLLRLTYNSVRIMTIPKIGYKHMNLRDESLFWDYKYGFNKMEEEEVKFWISAAKKEYFFTDDREIKYVENV